MDAMAILLIAIFLFSMTHLVLFGLTYHLLTRSIKPLQRGYGLMLSLVLGFALIGMLYAYLNWYHEQPPRTANGEWSDGEPLDPTAALFLGLFSLPLSVWLCYFWEGVRHRAISAR